ncbi:unnamed protein product [Prunus brigantina]
MLVQLECLQAKRWEFQSHYQGCTVQSELEEDNHGVSENLRWLAAGPNIAVPLYRSYLIKGDVIIECEPFTRGMPNVDTFDELVGELGGQNIRDGCEDIWIE